uniref:acyltransferase n=1 Tax=Sphingomonas yabuuchiae TaxID=172044 RepID=UPI003D95FC30
MLRQIYLGPLGRVISFAMRAVASLKRPFMVYGYRDKVSGKFQKLTRISSNVILGDAKNIAIGNNVWIWHHSIIDGSNGVSIGEGSQIGAWVGIFSHGSQISVRLYGDQYIKIPKENRKGYTRGRVTIGRYAFIGAGAKIMPGVTIGDGALIAAGAIVSCDVPDFGIARGSPAKVVGDVRKLDEKFWNDPEIARSYFDSQGRKAWIEAKHED